MTIQLQAGSLLALAIILLTLALILWASMVLTVWMGWETVSCLLRLRRLRRAREYVRGRLRHAQG